MQQGWRHTRPLVWTFFCIIWSWHKRETLQQLTLILTSQQYYPQMNTYNFEEMGQLPVYNTYNYRYITLTLCVRHRHHTNKKYNGHSLSPSQSSPVLFIEVDMGALGCLHFGQQALLWLELGDHHLTGPLLLLVLLYLPPIQDFLFTLENALIIRFFICRVLVTGNRTFFFLTLFICTIFKTVSLSGRQCCGSGQIVDPDLTLKSSVVEPELEPEPVETKLFWGAGAETGAVISNFGSCSAVPEPK